MTLGDDHREEANVLLPPALPLPARRGCGSLRASSPPCALLPPSSPLSSSSSSSSSAVAPFSPLTLFPAYTPRSSYHNRRHPSCITCHFVPRRILSPRHDNRARIGRGNRRRGRRTPSERGIRRMVNKFLSIAHPENKFVY